MNNWCTADLPWKRAVVLETAVWLAQTPPALWVWRGCVCGWGGECVCVRCFHEGHSVAEHMDFSELDHLRACVEEAEQHYEEAKGYFCCCKVAFHSSRALLDFSVMLLSQMFLRSPLEKYKLLIKLESKEISLNNKHITQS